MILMVKRKLLYWFKVAVNGPYHIDFIDKVGLNTGMHATEIVIFCVLYRKSKIKDTSDNLITTLAISSLYHIR